MKERASYYLALNNKMYRIFKKLDGSLGKYVFKADNKNVAKITVNCQLPGVTIKINDMPVNEMSISKGTMYSWSVSKSGYNTLSGYGTLDQDTTILINYIALNKPANASSTINGTVVASNIQGTDGLLFEDGTTVNYVYTISGSGATQYDGTGIATTSTTENIGALTVVTDIENADITINNATATKVFFNKQATFQYSAAIHKTGYKSLEIVGGLDDSRTISFSALDVTCNVPTAEIKINNENYSGVFFETGTSFSYTCVISVDGEPDYTESDTIIQTRHINKTYTI